MKPAPFQYHRPTTITETTDLLAEHQHDAELMAGNQSLGILMANRLATPDHIIDINEVTALEYIEISEEKIEIGALTRHRTIENSTDLAESLPMFPAAAEQIAGPSVRNRGTIGGSIGEADPAGNYPTVLTALEGDLHITATNEERTVPASEYFIAYMFTDLGPDELITGISINREAFPIERTGMAFLEQKATAQTWPTISAATVVRVDDPDASEPVIEEARIALANAADVPLRVERAEEAVEGEPLSQTHSHLLSEETLVSAAETAIDAADPSDEMHADREYKRELAGEYTRRSLETSCKRAIENTDITKT
jgi:carbon-monoxide dehydrogenase medium subunit